MPPESISGGDCVWLQFEKVLYCPDLFPGWPLSLCICLFFCSIDYGLVFSKFTWLSGFLQITIWLKPGQPLLFIGNFGEKYPLGSDIEGVNPGRI